MLTDEFLAEFPKLLRAVLLERQGESDEKNITALSIALISAGGYWTTTKGSNEAVDRALYLYEQIKAGSKKPLTAQDVVNATGETRINVCPHPGIYRGELCPRCGEVAG